MDALNSLVLTVLFSAILLYVLYFVIRAGVRDGMIQARKRSATDTDTDAMSREADF